MKSNIKMVTPMVIELEGKRYTLEFSKETIMESEKAGLDITAIASAPMNTVPLLFHYAFKMHHPDITRDETDRILFDVLNGMEEAEYKKLSELYNAQRESLFHNKDAERKNVKISL